MKPLMDLSVLVGAAGGASGSWNRDHQIREDALLEGSIWGDHGLWSVCVQQRAEGSGTSDPREPHVHDLWAPFRKCSNRDCFCFSASFYSRIFLCIQRFFLFLLFLTLENLWFLWFLPFLLLYAFFLNYKPNLNLNLCVFRDIEVKKQKKHWLCVWLNRRDMGRGNERVSEIILT